jgi:hypothetical protein
VLTALEEAELREDPRWDHQHEDWICTLHKLVAGRRITVVVAVDSASGEVAVVTVYERR